MLVTKLPRLSQNCNIPASAFQNAEFMCTGILISLLWILSYSSICRLLLFFESVHIILSITSVFFSLELSLADSEWSQLSSFYLITIFLISYLSLNHGANLLSCIHKLINSTLLCCKKINFYDQGMLSTRAFQVRTAGSSLHRHTGPAESRKGLSSNRE